MDQDISERNDLTAVGDVCRYIRCNLRQLIQCFADYFELPLHRRLHHHFAGKSVEGSVCCKFSDPHGGFANVPEKSCWLTPHKKADDRALWTHVHMGYGWLWA